MATKRVYYVKVGEDERLAEASSQAEAVRMAVQHMGLEVHAATAGEVMGMMSRGVVPLISGLTETQQALL
jgi:hypothetical protein